MAKSSAPPPRRDPPQARGKTAAPSIDTKLVEALARIACGHDLSEIVVEHEGLHIRVGRQMTAQAQVMVAAPAAAPTFAPAPAAAAIPVPAAAPSGDHPGAGKSPLVGTASRRPSLGSKLRLENPSRYAQLTNPLAQLSPARNSG